MQRRNNNLIAELNVRPLSEIISEIPQAQDFRNTQQLLSLADELHCIGTLQALAIEARCRGVAARIESQFTLALEWLEKARALFQELGDLKGFANTTTSIGIVYEEMASSEKALGAYAEALEINTKLGDKKAMGRISSNIGAVYTSQGSHIEALEWLNKSVEIARELGDLGSLARAQRCIGLEFGRTGSLPEALQYSESAMSIFQDLGDQLSLSQSYVDVGSIHFENNNFSEAMKWYEKAVTLNEELGVKTEQIHSLSNIAAVHASSGNHNKALEYYRLASAVYDDIGEQPENNWILIYLARVHIELNQLDEARVVLNRLENFKTDERLKEIDLTNVRAHLLEADGDLDSAKKLYMETLQFAVTGDFRPTQASIHEALRNIAQKQNDFPAYIEHNNEYTRINEEIRGKDAALKIAMQAKEKEMRKEREDRERERGLLYSALPKSVADRMLRGEDVTGDHYNNASVLFLDIAGFTTISHSLSPNEVVNILKHIFKSCDTSCESWKITKIKTIGDSYMAMTTGDRG